MKKLMFLPVVFLICLFSLALASELAVAENCRLNSDCDIDQLCADGRCVVDNRSRSYVGLGGRCDNDLRVCRGGNICGPSDRCIAPECE